MTVWEFINFYFFIFCINGTEHDRTNQESAYVSTNNGSKNVSAKEYWKQHDYKGKHI